MWALTGKRAPDHGVDAGAPLVIDLDATLVTAHSGQENARPTFKRGFGFHPLCALADHGPAGTGELLHLMLRPERRQRRHHDQTKPPQEIRASWLGDMTR